MWDYNIIHWCIFFAIYCFAGWCFECVYVSMCEKKLTNRGFLTGPFLPIYGSGAIIILIATIPAKNNYVLVFIFGMIAATALEYITGVVMERALKMRYWDYSDETLNYKGYICLKASLTWGLFSVLLIRIIHKPVEQLVFRLDIKVGFVLAVVFALIFFIDLMLSIRSALDLKEMLKQITDNLEEVKRLQKRLDVLIAVTEEDRKEFIRNMEMKISEGKAMYRKARLDIRLMLKAHPRATSERFRDALVELKEYIYKK